MILYNGMKRLIIQQSNIKWYKPGLTNSTRTGKNVTKCDKIGQNGTKRDTMGHIGTKWDKITQHLNKKASGFIKLEWKYILFLRDNMGQNSAKRVKKVLNGTIFVTSLHKEGVIIK